MTERRKVDGGDRVVYQHLQSVPGLERLHRLSHLDKGLRADRPADIDARLNERFRHGLAPRTSHSGTVLDVWSNSLNWVAARSMARFLETSLPQSPSSSRTFEVTPIPSGQIALRDSVVACIPLHRSFY